MLSERVRLAAALAALLALAACENAGSSTVSRPAVMRYREVGSWSGRGNLQTESFTSDSGGFRVRWRTRNETAPGAGTLVVTFRSAVSGRDIMEAVNARGVDEGTVTLGDIPRVYFLVIESAHVDWTVVVEEPVAGVPK